VSTGLLIQSRIASFVASFKVLDLKVLGELRHLAFSYVLHLALDAYVNFAHIDDTLQSHQAHTVAVATPCCPAPVSAIIRVLPKRLASKICPMVLLILCAVWHKSSLLDILLYCIL
jgi:hypothetical protein